MSRTSRGARTLASSPGITQSTPLGLALAEETFAIRREMPLPIEQLRCGRDHSALVALASDYYGLPFQRRIVKLFHGNEEGIHVDVEDGFRGDRHGGTQIVDEKQSSEPPETAWNFWSSRGRLRPVSR